MKDTDELEVFVYIIGLILATMGVFFFALVLTLMSTNLFGEEPPAILKDAIITVHLKDGSTAKFNANQWKVVPRLDRVKPKAKVVSKPATKPSEDLMNRVSLLGGAGPQGLKIRESSGQAKISNKKEAVIGLSYQRKIGKRLSVGGQAVSNGTYLLGIGLDF